MVAILKKFAPQSDKQAFWLSLFLCLFICSLILFVISPITGLSKNFGAGNDGYIQLARSLVAGDGYVFVKGGPPVFNRPPLYPVFLMPVALFPENLQRYIIVIPQSVLIGFIGMMIFRITRQLYNKNIALVALSLFLVNPWIYWAAKSPMVTVLQTFLYIYFFYFVAIELFALVGLKGLTEKYKSAFRILFIGVFGAGLSLVHAAMMPVVFVFIFILFIAAFLKNKKRLLIEFIPIIIVFCFIVPWTYRNWVVFHSFIPIAGGGGLNYFNGNVHWLGIETEPQKPREGNIDASLRVMGIKGTEANDIQWKGFKDIRYEELANKKMAEHIKNHPTLFAKKVILNAIEYYFPAFTKPFCVNKSTRSEEWGLSIFHVFLWVLAIAGIFYSLRKGFLLMVCIVFYAVWYFPFACFIGHAVYAFGTIPFLSILAATGIVYFSQKMGRGGR